MTPARQSKALPGGITCPKCGAEIITKRTSRQPATYRVRHREDGTHAMERLT